MGRILFLVPALAVIIFGATPAKQPAPAQGRAATTGANDAVIEGLIKSKLSKSKIAADKFKVRVQGGVAYWDGTTDVPQHKGAATRMARTAGAVRVVNNIQVSEAGKAKSRAQFEKAHRSEPRSAVVRR